MNPTQLKSKAIQDLKKLIEDYIIELENELRLQVDIAVVKISGTGSNRQITVKITIQ